MTQGVLDSNGNLGLACLSQRHELQQKAMWRRERWLVP